MADGSPGERVEADASEPRLRRTRLLLRGVVQGVGMRPFLAKVAHELGLSGWAWNSSDGVEVEVQGRAAAIDRFVAAVRTQGPPASRVDSLAVQDLQDLAAGASGSAFVIRDSVASDGRSPVLPPDLAMCPSCSAEVADPSDRRYGYAFTSCSHCGPRFSIVEALPYDRSRTTMRAFPLCPECARELHHLEDRRYHAQPIACGACGPRLRLLASDGTALSADDDGVSLARAAELLLKGEVLALKGLGGFQLLTDATSPAAVGRLRARKHRPEKPMAVMFSDVASLARSCVASPTEQRELASARAPIVLLRKVDRPEVCEEVAPENPRLGALLPSTPLHQLLLRAVGRPLVCTSGNLTEEPMAFEDEEALARLAPLADGFLTHGRRVARPVDDSVVRVDGERVTLLRRARGYVPLDHRHGVDAMEARARGPVLALGGHEKSTIALLRDDWVVVSQHLGDLASPEALALLERTVSDFIEFFRSEPRRLACDLHPDYASTQLAERLAARWGLPLIRVQHHHAHALSCATDAGLTGPFLALTWDGAGLGLDGTLWGGEALAVDERRGATRVGQLRAFPLPGGEAASRDPRRSALGLWWASFPDRRLEQANLWFTPRELDTLRRATDAGLNAPLTSSVGRLFDAVAALTGVRARSGFEGQAAMALEATAERAGGVAPLPLDYTLRGDVLEADPRPLLEGLAARSATEAAAAFHEGLARLALRFARHAGLGRVALSGGCFQNALLTRRVRGALEGAGFEVVSHRAFPPNDGGLSLGQAVAALTLERREA